MRYQDAWQIPISHLLAALGHQPVKETNGELWYRSPLRQEEDASFKLSADQRAFFDHGSGQGGGIIDFALAYFHASSVSAALHEIERYVGTKGQTDQAVLFPDLRREQPAPAAPSAAKGTEKPERQGSDIRRASVKPLANTTLIAYLEKNRCIPLDLAKRYVQEVYFLLEGKERWYFSIAFRNDSGGVEMRNANDERKYKRCYGKKDITTIVPEAMTHPEAVLLFEGFTDMLSWLVYYQTPVFPASVIVLNSTAMKEKAVQKIRSMGVTDVRLYLDQDNSGRSITAFFEQQLTDRAVTDMSALYQGFRDFNEFLKAQRWQAQPQPV